MAVPQEEADPELRLSEGLRYTSPDEQMIPGGAGSERTDGGVASVEAEKTAKTEPPGEQMEGKSGSQTSTGGR